MSKSIEAAPLISIILPVHNGSKYIIYALESLCAQTYVNFELIIIDDFSTDETPSIIAEYASRDNRIRVITNKENLKLPASLNVGMNSASGKWLTWTSDDNILEPDCIKSLVENAIAKNADFIFANYHVINETGSILRTNKTGPSDLIYLENTIGACFLYRREIFDFVGPYAEDKFLYEDYDYWVRIYRAGFVFFHLNQALYNYRIHGSQLSTRKSLPKDFTHYRFDLIRLIPNSDTELKARAYLSSLNLAIKSRIFLIFAKCFMHLLLTPLITFKLLLRKLTKI
jgi:glycosyltransferase involved in cell wall biosynthesis